jgi:hypothetical protein
MVLEMARPGGLRIAVCTLGIARGHHRHRGKVRPETAARPMAVNTSCLVCIIEMKAATGVLLADVDWWLRRSGYDYQDASP